MASPKKCNIINKILKCFTVICLNKKVKVWPYNLNYSNLVTQSVNWAMRTQLVEKILHRYIAIAFICSGVGEKGWLGNRETWFETDFPCAFIVNYILISFSIYREIMLSLTYTILKAFKLNLINFQLVSSLISSFLH